MTSGWLLRTGNGLGQLVDGVLHPLDGLEDGAGEIALAPGAHWLLASEALGVWCSADGLAWRPLPPPPRPLAMDALGLHPHLGAASLFGDGPTLIGTEAGWTELGLPHGATWLGADKDGHFWAVGSRPATRVKGVEREAAYWQQDGTDWVEQPVRLPWLDAARAIGGGGLESFSAIDALGDPLVLGSQCAWFLDDPSWFLFALRNDGRFRVTRLRDRRLVRLLRDEGGRPVAVTDDGERRTWNGRAWKVQGLARRLRQQLDTMGVAPRRAIQLDGTGDHLRGTVTTWDPELVQGVASDDGGKSWWSLELPEGTQVVAGWVRPAR